MVSEVPLKVNVRDSHCSNMCQVLVSCVSVSRSVNVSSNKVSVVVVFCFCYMFLLAWPKNAEHQVQQFTIVALHKL